MDKFISKKLFEIVLLKKTYLVTKQFELLLRTAYIYYVSTKQNTFEFTKRRK